MADYNQVSVGDNVSVICQNEECLVFELKNETGEGFITCYNVFPGVELLYNNFHMGYFHSQVETRAELLCIDHCREGRLEWEAGNGSYIYLGAGDLHITTHEESARPFSFPLNHYHGLTIGIDTKEVAKSISTIFKGFDVDVKALREKFDSESRSFIMRSDASVEHIFSELYNVSDAFRLPYQKIKVMELLLFLSRIDAPKENTEVPYFSKTQVDKIKAIKQFIGENVETHFTQEELSKRFDMPLTTMKLCFKGMYGTSIYAYSKEYRMKLAAELLLSSDENIATIAARLGYDNASKFAVAFKSIMGKSPGAYKKSIV